MNPIFISISLAVMADILNPKTRPLISVLSLNLFLCSLAWSDPITTSRQTAVVRAVEEVRPAVVSVHVTHREQVFYRSRDPFMDFFFPYYRVIPGERNRTSGGSGIITEGGYILTNGHVIGNSRSITKIVVSLSDSRAFAAEYIDHDTSFDLAILKVEEDDLPVAPLGNSDDILVGEWAIAIGNPFDLGPTVSIGVVSAVDRDFQEPKGNYYYRDMIQTDAAINPGNSGGPLVNAAGEVIGINSFIYTGGEFSVGSIGIGFAIPINAARSFLEEIRRHGQVRRPWTGILSLQNLTPLLAEYLSLSSTDGALIVKIIVDVDSPAYLAGLEEGDVIVAIDGEKVRGADEAVRLLQPFRVDEECTLTVARNGGLENISLRFGERPRSRRRW